MEYAWYELIRQQGEGVYQGCHLSRTFPLDVGNPVWDLILCSGFLAALWLETYIKSRVTW